MKNKVKGNGKDHQQETSPQAAMAILQKEAKAKYDRVMKKMNDMLDEEGYVVNIVHIIELVPKPKPRP